MSFSNQTQHYGLPQYIGTDKPTYLGDMNGAYKTIDDKLFEANTNATSVVNQLADVSKTAQQANNTANANTTNISQLSADYANLSNKVTVQTPILLAKKLAVSCDAGISVDNPFIRFFEVTLNGVGTFSYLSWGAVVTCTDSSLTVTKALNGITVPELSTYLNFDTDNTVCMGCAYGSSVSNQNFETQLTLQNNIPAHAGVYTFACLPIGNSIIPKQPFYVGMNKVLFRPEKPLN